VIAPMTATCQQCGQRFPYRVGMGHTCQPKRAVAVASGVKRPKAGAMAEIGMRAILDSLGYCAIENAGEYTLAKNCYVAEFVFAPHERNWRCDFALPVKRLAVEVDGGAHAAGKSKQRTDTEKRGELAARGYRVVAVTPEEVKDGTARDRVSRALEAS